MNKKYFSTDLSNAPRCIHEYAGGDMQANAIKVAKYYDDKLKGLGDKVSDPSHAKEYHVRELKRIAPDSNPKTGYRMVKNMVSAEVMHIPVTKQIHATIDIGGVAKHAHDVQQNVNVQPQGDSSGSSSSGNVKSNITVESLNDIAKHAGQTFTGRVNKIAGAFVDVAGIKKAKSIFADWDKATSSNRMLDDFLGGLELYVRFINTMTTEWLMLATSTGSGGLDKKVFCCLLKNMKGGKVDPTQVIGALAKLKAFMNLASNLLDVYNSFLGLINRFIKVTVAAASAMLADLFSKFYDMLIIPYVSEVENFVSGDKIVSDGEIEKAKKDMNAAFALHKKLEDHFKKSNVENELKSCNFISATFGGIPLSMSDDLLKQMVKMLQIHAGEIGQQIHISKLQTMEDIVDQLIHVIDNIVKLGVLSSNGAFCNDVKMPTSSTNSGGKSPDTGNYVGSKPGTYDTIPDYGTQVITDPNSGNPGVNVTPVAQLPNMQNVIKNLLDNTGFFDTKLGYSSKTPLGGKDIEPSQMDNAKYNYVMSLTYKAKSALSASLADELSSLFDTPINPEDVYTLIDARFSNAVNSAAQQNDNYSSAMAAYAKDVDRYVQKLS